MLQFTLTHVEADILNLTKSLMKANETKLFHAAVDLLGWITELSRPGFSIKT